MQHAEPFIYHPKLLKILTREQLDILVNHSFCNSDREDQIHILYSGMDFGSFEIYCDCDAEKLECAIIYVQFQKTQEEARLNGNEFWELYTKSKPQECVQIGIDF